MSQANFIALFSGLDKRQCNVQLTLFGDGVSRVKPLVIYLKVKVKVKKIPLAELAQYDRRVNIHFQENAWCDESVMTYWARHCWKPHIEAPTFLILDEHKAQKTDALMDIHRLKCRTTPVLVPAGCMSLVQPLDVV